MRTWILLALLGLVLLISMTYREGLTNPPTPQCSNGGTLTGNTCSDVNGSPGNPVCPSGYSFTPASGGNGRCVQVATDSLDTYGYNAAGQINSTSEIGQCNIYWDAAIAKWATGAAAASDASPTCMTYAPSWIVASMNENTLLNSDKKPTQATITKALAFTNSTVNGKTYAQEQEQAAGYAASTGYAALAAAAVSGTGPSQSLPTPISESASSDIGANRPSAGSVYTASDSPFSGQAGTGQGTASNVTTGSSSYGSGAGYSSNVATPNTGAPSGPVTTTVSPSTNMNRQVGGPKWGGLGAPVSSSSNASASMITGPTLYGPTAAQNKNIETKNWMPSYWSAGSEFGNMFAGTSRSPGDQDLIPNPYLQSAAYSLANGLQKTNPVPFLPDFSAFQS